MIGIISLFQEKLKTSSEQVGEIKNSRLIDSNFVCQW